MLLLGTGKNKKANDQDYAFAYKMYRYIKRAIEKILT